MEGSVSNLNVMADYVFSGLNSPGGSGEDSSAGENDGVLRVSSVLTPMVFLEYSDRLIT